MRRYIVILVAIALLAPHVAFLSQCMDAYKDVAGLWHLTLADIC